MDKTTAYHQRLLQLLASGEIADKKELLRRKIAGSSWFVCREPLKMLDGPETME